MGQYYALGHGVAKDYAEAVKWYRQAAEQNHAEAQLKLGNCFADGLGVARDYPEAVRWYRRAAEQNVDAEAQINLAYCYAFGKGVKQDHAEAYAWSDLATNKDRSAAILRGDLKRQLSAKKLAAAQKRAAELRVQIDARRNGDGKKD